MPTRPPAYRPPGRTTVRLPDHRPSSTARAYDWTWRKFSRAYLRAHPLCVYCKATGRLIPARHTDHIRALTGPYDPEKYNPDNLAALCHSCHSRKTVREDGALPGRKAREAPKDLCGAGPS